MHLREICPVFTSSKEQLRLRKQVWLTEYHYNCVRRPYLRDTGAGIGVAWSMVAKSWQTGQDEVNGTNLQSHAAQENTIVSGQRSAAEQRT